MKFHNITKDDMLNGDGLRVVLWVSGCTHHCKNCQNQLTWDINCGVDFNDKAEKEIFCELRKNYVSGLTLSGGDPLHPANRKTMTDFAKKVKSMFPNKTIWLYTGFKYEEISNEEILNYIDVVVDGKFVEELKDVKLHWKGSSNQRVIDVKKTLSSGEIVLKID